MTITISGTTGIAGVDGSAATPSVQGGDTNTGVFFPAADTIAFAEGGTEVMRINSSAQIVASAGTAALPSFTATGDTNTGVFFPATDAVGMATNGVERLRIDTSGNLLFNSGYGSVATAYGCRAWVNFDGTTNVGGFCTIRGSGNVTSVADNGTGDYTVNLTVALPDTNYNWHGNGTTGTTATNNRMTVQQVQGIDTKTTSTLRIITMQGSAGTSLFDAPQVCITFFR